MNKDEFTKLFNEAMTYTTCYNHWQDDGGINHSEEFEVPACITIRDFDSDYDNESWSPSITDKDFTDLEEAWEYLQTVQRYRIITANGVILADNVYGSD